MADNPPTIDAYRKTYKMRAVGSGGQTIEVSMPPEVIKREATKRGLTIQEFIDQYRAIAHYNNFDGVLYQFEEIPSEGQAQSASK